MFRRVRNFFYNHRRKFLFGGVFFGTLVLLVRYARGKLRDWQEKELNELLERSRRRQHFESTERTCDQTALTFASNLRTAIIKCLNCEKIVNELRDGSAKDKITAWNTLKALAITKTATIIYSYTMLIITLRIQLNVLGGSILRDSKIPDVSPESQEKINDSMKEKYLSLCGYLMEDGVKKLSMLIKERVEEITSNYSLSDKLRVQDMQNIYWALTSTVSAENRDPVKNFSSYVIAPDFFINNQSNKPLAKLLDQTLDLLESQEVQELMQNNIRSGFALLVDRITEFFNENVKSTVDIDQKDALVNLNAVTMPMAKIIPILNGQVPENATFGDLSSDWLQRLLLSEELKALGANIYEAFCY